MIPLPYEEWTRAHRRAIFPLTLCLSFAWALELCVTPSSFAPSYAPSFALYESARSRVLFRRVA